MSRPRIRLLIPNDPHPMRIERDLANEIGLNESIVLLQLEYLIGISQNERDGLVWTYHSLEDLKRNFFPWWSTATINRILQKLKDMDLITIGNYNKLGYDRTQWYALNEVGVRRLSSAVLHTTAISQNEKSILQNDQMDLSKMRNPFDQNETTIPKSTHENTHKNDRAPRKSADAPETKELTPHQAIMDAYAQALGYPIKDGAKEGNAAKWLVKNNYTPAQVVGCYQSLRADPWWEGKHISLQTVAGKIGAWSQAKHKELVPPTVAAARQPQQPSGPSESLRPILAERRKAHEGK